MSEDKENQPLTIDQPYLRIESWGYKGVDFEFLGVNHNLVTLQAKKDTFEREFAKNDVVLLEGAPRAEGLIDQSGRITDATIEAYRQTYQLPPQEIRRRLENLRSTIDFFAGLEQMAGEMGKDVIVFDPFSMSPEGVRQGEGLKEWDQRLAGIKAMVLTAVPGTIGTAGGYFAVKEAVRGHSRRAFLAGATAAAGLAIAGTMLKSTVDEGNRVQTAATINKPNPLTFALLDFIDYRNIAITKTFATLADAGELDPKVAGVYGDAHRAQIKYYFEHQSLGNHKLMTAYKSMTEISPPRYRRFHYQGNNTWAKTQDRIIK